MFIWQQKYFIFGFHFRLTAFQTTFKVLSMAESELTKLKVVNSMQSSKPALADFLTWGTHFPEIKLSQLFPS
jgi:hypothetical protein